MLVLNYIAPEGLVVIGAETLGVLSHAPMSVVVDARPVRPYVCRSSAAQI